MEEEEVHTPEGSAQGYLTSLSEVDDINWDNAEYRRRLSRLLEQSYAQSLRRLVSALSLKHTPEDADKMATVLRQLAALHQKQGGETSELSHYTDAATCCQHALRVWEEAQASHHERQIEKAYEGLAQIKTSMIASIKQAQGQDAPSNALTPEVLRKEIEQDKQALEVLREDSKQRLAEIDSAERKNGAEYVEKSRALFADIAERIGKFLGRLYAESEVALGPAPCKYTVVGLGSMALQQMTPYSDLEFAILMEDSEDEAILAEHRAYFRQLSHLVHLRVINLGETVLPMSKYGVVLDRLAKRGINFDLGGKTPLGRPDEPYDLIQPVAGMMGYLRNEGDQSTHQDKLLPFILERTCYVHGDKALHAAYVRESEEFLKEGKTEQGVPVYQARAREKLLPALHSPESDTANPRGQGDIADFKVQFDMGRLYDVKQEIYRLPDRLLYRLAMYYGLLPESGWDAVDQLRDTEVISEAAVSHLQYAVSFATLLRLRTYLNYGQQKEVMGVHGVTQVERQEAASQSFALPPAALQEGGSLFKYYYTAIPLHRKMEEFFTLKQPEEFLKPKQLEEFSKLKGDALSDEDFFREESFCAAGEGFYKGLIFHRLMQHEKEINCYEEAIKEHKESHGDGAHADLATILNNAAGAYEELGDVQKGLTYQEQALEMQKALYGNQPHPAVATSLSNVGVSYEKLGDEQKSLMYYEQALEMRKTLYGDRPHPAVATSLNNVGLAYGNLGDAQKSLMYYKQALEMRKALYGDQPHLDIATSLYNVGSAYWALGEVAKTIQCYEEVLKVLPKGHGLRRGICHNLGCAHHLSALKADTEEDKETHIAKATEYFEAAVAASSALHAGVLAEYANFLLHARELQQAYIRLTQAIASGDNASELGYGWPEQATVALPLQERITQEEAVAVRAIDYAFYLLLHHYDAFEKAGITPEAPKAAYLAAYEQGIQDRAGQPGKEKQDELAQCLLSDIISMQPY